MALLGQGDPRWKVQDRKDGKNVNAWHWTEKNCTKWSQDKLKELFTNLVVCDVGNCKIVEVSKNTGEITYCNRKRKDLFFYDLDIVLKWEGKLEKIVKGEVKFNLSEDTPLSETKIRVTTTTNGESSDKIKDPISQQAPAKIIDTLTLFFDKLREQFSEDTGEFIPVATFEGVPIELVPELSPNHSNPNLSNPNVNERNNTTPTQINGSNNNNAAPKKPSISTKTLTEKLSFEAPAGELFECLLDPQRLSAFTQSSVEIERTVGGRFSLFGGQIHGVISSFDVPQKIVQKWRFRDWPDDHYSVVTITLESNNNGTQLTLKQTGIPSSDFDRTQSGWKTHFWTRIRGTFGFNFKQL